MWTFWENVFIVSVSAGATYVVANSGAANLGVYTPFVVAGLTALLHVLNGVTGVGDKVKSML
jgi:hypothetical protein